MKRKPIYIALTTLNAQMSGYFPLAAGHNRQAVGLAARGAIGYARTPYGGGMDIYTATEHRNLVVVSRTKAKREFGFDTWIPEVGPHERYRWIE